MTGDLAGGIGCPLERHFPGDPVARVAPATGRQEAQEGRQQTERESAGTWAQAERYRCNLSQTEC